jgi:uncharacterized phage-like protein YoqJ
MSDSNIKVPIIVGVTGHRDIMPYYEDKIKNLVKGRLEKIANRYPSSPLVIMSQLATGADTWVAQVALDLSETYDIKIVGALPRGRESFYEDFNAEEKLELINFLDHPKTKVVNTEALYLSKYKTPLGRKEKYAVASEFIAYNSNLLIALWDGLVTDQPEIGGTEWTVNYKLDGQINSQGFLYREAREAGDFHTGVVYHITSPRKRTTYDQPFGLEIVERILPKGKVLSKLTDQLDQIDAHNAMLGKTSDK